MRVSNQRGNGQPTCDEGVFVELWNFPFAEWNNQGGGVSKVCCRDLEDIVADLPIGNRIRRSSLLASDGDVTSRCRSRRMRRRSPGGQCAVVVSSQMIEVNAERTEMMKAIPVFIAVLDKIWGVCRHQTHRCVLVPRMRTHTVCDL